jgi:hypothetical protein
MGSYDDNHKAITRLYEETLVGIADRTELFERFQLLCERYDQYWKSRDLFKTNSWRNSMVRRLLQVNERLRLVRLLENDGTPDLEKKYLYPPLTVYLLLTCFDQLGQPDKWMPFDSWLKSKRSRQDREALRPHLVGLTADESAARLFRAYQDSFGVKSSFFRFLHDILPHDQREAMFSQMRMEFYRDYPRDLRTREGVIEEKEVYLFRVRNDYTHNVYARGPRHDLFKTALDSEWREDDIIYGDGTTYRILTTRRFYSGLKLSVSHGIWHRLLLETS